MSDKKEPRDEKEAAPNSWGSNFRHWGLAFDVQFHDEILGIIQHGIENSEHLRDQLHAASVLLQLRHKLQIDELMQAELRRYDLECQRLELELKRHKKWWRR